MTASSQLELFPSAAPAWTRPDECACDRCRWGVWQRVEPHAFYCIAPWGGRVNARNRAATAERRGCFEPRAQAD